MKLRDILHEEIGFDTHLARETDKHLSGPKTNTVDMDYEVEFTLFDENGDEIEINKSSDAPSYPEMIEIEVTGIESYNANPKSKHEDEEEIVFNYDDAEVEITNSSKKELKDWLETRSDYNSIIDYTYDINFEDESGSVTAIAVK